VELPTYTNIWKIEKRLYKLYDFRLPMPLPVGQVVAFLAIAVPYTLILTMAGMPFSHTWLWLYILPPGVLAWLVTRPVLEGKRLPELLVSQLRYVTEPRTWCRLAPLTEKDDITATARLWRLPAVATPAVASAAARTRQAPKAAPAPQVPKAAPSPATAEAAPTRQVPEAAPAPQVPEAAPEGAFDPKAPEAGRSARPVWPDRPLRTPQPQRPVVTVRTRGQVEHLIPVVERAMRSSVSGSMQPEREPVVVVPGGYRPGKPDHLQRDRARARLPLPGPARIVFLGCAAGAGQTTTALLTGQMLASLRGEAVAVLDMKPGPGSLTQLARAIPRLMPSQRDVGDPVARTGKTSRRHGPDRGLQIVTAHHQSAEPENAGQLIDMVVERFPLALADPKPAHVPQALCVADELVLVMRAGAEAAAALAMTFEWLDANGHENLARAAITVLNGATTETAEDIDQAAAIANGRCRAIVRIGFDSALASGGALGVGAIRAYTALAGLVVSGLSQSALSESGSR